MDLGMTDKKAIVTGASEGIGKAIARALAGEGVDVAICARRKGPLEQTAAGRGFVLQRHSHRRFLCRRCGR